jgi:hypothetical protein
MNKMKNVLIGLLAVLVIVFAILCGSLANKPAEIKEVQVPVIVSTTVVDNSTLAELAELKAKINSLNEFEVEADEQAQNDTAKMLVMSEKDVKSFRLAVLDALEEEGYNIESYKDLNVYSFKIDSVNLEGDSAEANVTFKVSGFEAGDEEDSFKVRMSATMLVEDLDVDEDFEDSEVSEDYVIVFEKEYD